MLAQIGLVLGLYVLARLTAGKLSKVVGVIAVVVTVLVTADLTVQALLGAPISAIIRSRSPAVGSAPELPRSPVTVPTTATTSVTRVQGGSITTVLGYGYALAKDSTLQREWIAVHDASVPVRFEGTPGVTTVYRSQQYGGEYRYVAKFTLAIQASVQAVQVRFLTFDVWGDHVQTLSFEDVADMPANQTRTLAGEWRLFSENDAEKYYASIGYVSRVRLADGRVVAAADGPVIEEAKKFSAKFSAQDLEPTRPTPNPGPAAGARGASNP